MLALSLQVPHQQLYAISKLFPFPGILDLCSPAPYPAYLDDEGFSLVTGNIVGTGISPRTRLIITVVLVVVETDFSCVNTDGPISAKLTGVCHCTQQAGWSISKQALSFFISAVLQVEPWALCMVHSHVASEPHPLSLGLKDNGIEHEGQWL